MNHLSNQETNELFDTNGPLSTFSSKIQICYGIKIIDRAQKYDAHHGQKIRNAFAHGFLGLSFDLEQIRNACKLLKTPARWPEHESWSPRQQFIFTCAVLWLKLGDFADGFVYNRDKGLQLFTRDPA